VHKSRQFIEIQFAVMILVGACKLHFQKPEYLILGHRFRGRNGSHIVLDRHEKPPAVKTAMLAREAGTPARPLGEMISGGFVKMA
jgi:hypothetical protein